MAIEYDWFPSFLDYTRITCVSLTKIATNFLHPKPDVHHFEHKYVCGLKMSSSHDWSFARSFKSLEWLSTVLRKNPSDSIVHNPSFTRTAILRLTTQRKFLLNNNNNKPKRTQFVLFSVQSTILSSSVIVIFSSSSTAANGLSVHKCVGVWFAAVEA